MYCKLVDREFRGRLRSYWWEECSAAITAYNHCCVTSKLSKRIQIKVISQRFDGS